MRVGRNSKRGVPGQPEPVAPTPTTVAAPGEPCSALPWWSSTESERLRSAIEAGQARPEPGNSPHLFSSQPVDVHAPGTYTFDFGPLDHDQFVYPPPASHVHPPGPAVVHYFPPDNPVSFEPTADPSIVVKDGTRYLRQPIALGGDVRPCTQLVVWLSASAV